MALSEQEIERAFALIEQAAASGERAPQSQPHGPLRRQAVTALYRAGRLKGAIYSGNFRVLTILQGPHAGKSTKPPSTQSPPYRIIDKRSSAPTRPAGAAAPSAPRVLSSAEIRKLAP